MDNISSFVSHFFRETQWRLTSEVIQHGMDLLPDLTKIEINCLHYSDSVIFWTNSDSEDDFNRIVDVCYELYKRSISIQIPIRGCLTYGELESIDIFTIKSTVKNVNFISALIYGPALIEAYQQSENLLLSACVLGDGLIKKKDRKVFNI